MDTVKALQMMVPLSEYVLVNKGQTLLEAFQTMEADKRKKNNAQAHRDALVLDDDGNLKGKVTMIDIFKALEPQYARLENSDGAEKTLSKDYVLKLFKDYSLWAEPLNDLCRKGASLLVADIMHVPDESEFVQEDDSLDKALHLYIMGVHQPLIVKKGDSVTGVLRLGDMFEEVRKRILTCSI